jgi:hypothetical protein
MKVPTYIETRSRAPTIPDLIIKRRVTKSILFNNNHDHHKNHVIMTRSQEDIMNEEFHTWIVFHPPLYRNCLCKSSCSGACPTAFLLTKNRATSATDTSPKSQLRPRNATKRQCKNDAKTMQRQCKLGSRENQKSRNQE